MTRRMRRWQFQRMPAFRLANRLAQAGFWLSVTLAVLAMLALLLTVLYLLKSHMGIDLMPGVHLPDLLARWL